MSADASSRSCAHSCELGSEFCVLCWIVSVHDSLVSSVCASWRGIAACHAHLHKCRRCCRVHVKARTGGERVQLWIRLGQGKFRASRAACRHDWC